MKEPYLTIAEINEKYPNQWVLIANPTLTRLHEVRGGHVVVCAAERFEFYRLVEAYPDQPGVRDFATWYTGPQVIESELVVDESGAA